MPKRKPTKRPAKKLTERVKKQIKDAKGKVRLQDYQGDALTYLKKYRSLANARKAKVNNALVIEGIKIPRNSDLYKTIAESARIKKQTVKKFVKENKGAIEKLIDNGRVYIKRETDYLISDIQKLPKSKRVYNYEKPIDRLDAIYALQRLLMSSVSVSAIVLLIYEVGYDLRGNMYLEIPMPNQYDDLIDDLEEMQGEKDNEDAADDQWTDFLDQYKTITYIKS